MRRLLLAALFAAACGPNAPAPVPIAKTEPAPAKAEPTKAEPTKAAETKIAAPANTAPTTPRPPEPPLTQEELDLIKADPSTLTPEKRRERSFALRRQCMQNPDSACARQLEEIRMAVESGALVPQLPTKSPPNAGNDLVLSAPGKADSGKADSGKTDSGKTATGKTEPTAPAGKTP